MQNSRKSNKRHTDGISLRYHISHTVCPTIKVDIDVSQAQSEAPILPELHI